VKHYHAASLEEGLLSYSTKVDNNDNEPDAVTILKGNRTIEQVTPPSTGLCGAPL